MQCKDRNGNQIGENKGQNKVLGFLYQTEAGRILLSVLIQPWVSKLAGGFLNTGLSKLLIAPFIRRNEIDMTDYEEKKYHSYNEFFSRKVKPDYRQIDRNSTHLIAPCDSRLSVYPISADARFCVKDTEYSMETLFHSRKLAKHYEGGTLCLFRLTVDDYHRYCYVDDGKKTRNYHIPGVFHTVNPLANDVCPIYKENTREFSLLHSAHFGEVLMMEVGALLVGKIVNNRQEAHVRRGEEKGRFEFGGSTVILCLEKGRAVIAQDIRRNSEAGIETKVRQGEWIGQS